MTVAQSKSKALARNNGLTSEERGVGLRRSFMFTNIMKNATRGIALLVLSLLALLSLGPFSHGADAPIPNAQQIFALRKLPEPLVPLVSDPQPQDNERLLAALTAFEGRQHSDDFSALEQFITANPQSAWRLAVLTNLGILYYHSGYFSKTMPAYLAAWESGKDATEGRAKALADRAAGEYTKMLSRLGRYPELKAFLNEVGERKFTGQATELILAGRDGAATMETRPWPSGRRTSTVSPWWQPTPEFQIR